MSSELKKLVRELEWVLELRGGLLDAPAREAFQVRIESLKRAIGEADAAELRQVRIDAFKLTADLLSMITNVITFLR